MPPIDLSTVTLDRRPGVILWRELADQLRDLVAKHEPGDTLPGTPAMADEPGVDIGVVRRALQDLAGEGLIVIRQGLPTQVAVRPTIDELVMTLAEVLDMPQAEIAADLLRSKPWLLSVRGQGRGGVVQRDDYGG